MSITKGIDSEESLELLLLGTRHLSLTVLASGLPFFLLAFLSFFLG